jgi:predicted ATPase with chaperone activity
MDGTDVKSQRPPAPRTLEETGLPFELVHQLVTKTLHISGELSGSELASRLGVLFSVIDPFLDELRRERFCDITGGAMGSQSYVYRLSEAGHTRALAFLERNQYVGKLPVPLSQYRTYMKEFSRRPGLDVSRKAVRDAYAHLVLSDRVLDQLGPAIANRHSLFIYGPPGNGKTVISQAIRNLLRGSMDIPHALSVDTEVIRMFDVLNHEMLPPDAPPAGLELDTSTDERWAHCRRPVITVGGEMAMESLDLGYGEQSGFYLAPLQALANGGVLVVDDFGRQRASPREMLNRWIVPLESRVDHLTLRTGQKFEMPFEVLVVFATNLNPLDLVDESFLRRIKYKVYAESPTKEQFIKIFENYCRDQNLRFDRTLVETLITSELEPRQIHLRGCQPRDIIEHALSMAEYIDKPRELTADLMAAACATYFLADDSSPAE